MEDPESVRASKMPRTDTVQAVLQRQSIDIPTPPKTFICPFCQARIGRKGLAGHLRNAYQIDKPEFFSFRPSRDMLHGRLGCAHCLSCSTTEAALKLHYQRATCPALLIEWVRDLHFGPVTPVPTSDLTSSETTPLSIDLPRPASSLFEHALKPSADSTDDLTGSFGLHIPADAPVWHSSLTHDLCVSSIPDQSSLPLTMSLTFGPEHRMSWFVQFTPLDCIFM